MKKNMNVLKNSVRKERKINKWIYALQIIMIIIFLPIIVICILPFIICDGIIVIHKIIKERIKNKNEKRS